MGITGLLGLLTDNGLLRPVHVREFAGLRVAVDGYCWLHRALYSVRTFDIDLSTGELLSVANLANYFLEMIRMMADAGIVRIVIVLDGNYLPGKEGTEAKRAADRLKNRTKGIELMQSPSPSSEQASLARRLLLQGIDISPQVACDVVNTVKAKLPALGLRCNDFPSKLSPNTDVSFLVAPYEADAQLTSLSITNQVDLVVSEDSDLIPYGCRKVIYKLDHKSGLGELYDRDNLKLLPSDSELKVKSTNTSTCDPSNSLITTGSTTSLSRNSSSSSLDKFSSFTFEMLVIMCILAGCDYLESLNSIGIHKSYALVKQHKTAEKVLRNLLLSGLMPTVPYIKSSTSSSGSNSHQTDANAPIENRRLYAYHVGFYKALSIFQHQYVFEVIEDGKIVLDNSTSFDYNSEYNIISSDYRDVVNGDENINKNSGRFRIVILPVAMRNLTPIDNDDLVIKMMSDAGIPMDEIFVNSVANCEIDPITMEKFKPLVEKNVSNSFNSNNKQYSSSRSSSNKFSRSNSNDSFITNNSNNNNSSNNNSIKNFFSSKQSNNSSASKLNVSNSQGSTSSFLSDDSSTTGLHSSDSSRASESITFDDTFGAGSLLLGQGYKDESGSNNDNSNNNRNAVKNSNSKFSSSRGGSNNSLKPISNYFNNASRVATHTSQSDRSTGNGDIVVIIDDKNDDFNDASLMNAGRKSELIQIIDENSSEGGYVDSEIDVIYSSANPLLKESDIKANSVDQERADNSTIAKTPVISRISTGQGLRKSGSSSAFFKKSLSVKEILTNQQNLVDLSRTLSQSEADRQVTSDISNTKSINRLNNDDKIDAATSNELRQAGINIDELPTSRIEMSVFDYSCSGSGTSILYDRATNSSQIDEVLGESNSDLILDLDESNHMPVQSTLDLSNFEFEASSKAASDNKNKISSTSSFIHGKILSNISASSVSCRGEPTTTASKKRRLSNLSSATESKNSKTIHLPSGGSSLEAVGDSGGSFNKFDSFRFIG